MLWKRMIVMLVVVGVLLGALFGLEQMKAIGMKKYLASQKPPPQTVTATVAQASEWKPQLAAVGSVRAVRGIDISSEVAGQVKSVSFRNGQEVAAGAALLQLNADTDLAQLQALQASADLAALVQKRNLEQFRIQAVSQAQVDADAADLRAKTALVAQQQALIDKKTIRAPFGGRLGIGSVNPGQYLNPGQAIVPLQSVDPVYVDFSLPQQQLAVLKTGQAIVVTVDAFPGHSYEGKLTSINALVDTATRNVQVEATVSNPKRELLPGMFANVSIDAGERASYLTLPQTAITYNPYGATVFVAKDGADNTKVAQQVFVTPGPTRGDQVAILKGLEAGATVVTSGQLKLKNGTVLNIDNKVSPSNDPNPTPQEK